MKTSKLHQIPDHVAATILESISDDELLEAYFFKVAVEPMIRNGRMPGRSNPEAMKASMNFLSRRQTRSPCCKFMGNAFQ